MRGPHGGGGTEDAPVPTASLSVLMGLTGVATGVPPRGRPSGDRAAVDVLVPPGHQLGTEGGTDPAHTRRAVQLGHP